MDYFKEWSERFKRDSDLTGSSQLSLHEVVPDLTRDNADNALKFRAALLPLYATRCQRLYMC